jgi:hypothetical protein
MDILFGIVRENVDPRRKQERADARMISEDHSAIANCSPKVINKQFDAWKYPERLAMYDQSSRTKGQED